MNIIKEIPSNPKWVQRKDTINIILHHAEAFGCSVHDIDDWHKQNGWAGIGYHFLVRKDGKVYEGRPIDILGAHTQGYNANSIGICFEGNFEIEQMPDMQRESGIELIRYIQEKYGKLKIFRHKDLGDTRCPGKNFPDSIIFESMKEDAKVEMTLDEALNILLADGIITSKEYWIKVCDIIKYQKELMINMAKHVK